MTLAVSATAPPSPLRDTAAASATPICATEVVSPEFMDEPMGPFDSYGERNDKKETNSIDQGTTNSLWHLLSTIYIPILLFKLRHFFFGFAGLVQSLVLGHCVRFLTTYFTPSPTTRETLAPWLEALLGNPNSKDPHAWPPPTLRVLAILTVIAFVVHPDGVTWIMLGKLRDAVYRIFESSSTCWSILVADFGIVPTVAALATFAALMFLIYVLHKTLSPRTAPRKGQTSSQTTAERKRNKKRKGNHAKGGRGRIKGKAKHHSAELCRAVSPPPSNKQHVDQVPPIQASSTKGEEEQVMTSSVDTSDDKTEFLPTDLMTKGATTTAPSRQRVTSCSTVETVGMDDQSIDESVSMQSVASAPSASSTSYVSHSPRSLSHLEEGKKKSTKNTERKKHSRKRGRKGSASKSIGTTVVSSPHADFSRPPTKNATPMAVVQSPLPGRSRSRRSGNPKASGRTLADRLSSPVPPASNDSLFSTPLSSPTHLTMRPAKMTTQSDGFSALQTPVLTSPTPSPSLFSSQPALESNYAPPTIAPTTLNGSASAQRNGANVLYNCPGCDSKGHGRYAPRKMELASFLSHVGLVGTVCDDLVEALDGVDALYTLSESQFELYNVSSEQKRRIDVMLEARYRERMESTLPPPTLSPPTTPIRPPPGLSAPAAKHDDQQFLASPPHPDLATACSYSEEPNPSVGYVNRTDVDFGASPHLATTTTSTSGTAPQPLPSLLSSYDVPNNSAYEQGVEEIEAELQELGGQMVGSILDFEG